jgi:hypothetical protein
MIYDPIITGRTEAKIKRLKPGTIPNLSRLILKICLTFGGASTFALS